MGARLVKKREVRGGAKGTLSAGRKTFAAAVVQTLADQRFSAAAVFDRIKEALGCDSDAELAWIFGTSPQNISNRKKRNSAPFREAIYVALWADVSLDYLLTGRGSLRPSDEG
jgi:CI repressor-like protein